MTMTAAEITIESENDRVVRWRAEALERAGYDHDSAASLAARPDVDLHRATALLEQGCTPELALRILL
jgi:hypothetical protein